MAGATQHQPIYVPVGYGDDTQSSEDTGNPRKNQTFPMCSMGPRQRECLRQGQWPTSQRRSGGHMEREMMGETLQEASGSQTVNRR